MDSGNMRDTANSRSIKSVYFMNILLQSQDNLKKQYYTEDSHQSSARNKYDVVHGD